MKRRVKIGVHLIAFAAIGLVIYSLLSGVLRPYQTNSMMTDKAQSFFSEPENTIQVAFLGSSTTANGFIPTLLFENEGICSYNLGSASQPMLASCLWTQEAERLHPHTLKTLVLDCSVLRFEPDDAFYRVVLDEIPLEDKFDPVMGWQNSGDDKLVYLDSLYAYHNRWDEVSDADVDKLSYPTHNFLRGYEPGGQRCVSEGEVSALHVPKEAPDDEVEPTELNSEQVHYFEQLVDYCEQHHLNLVLVKTPIFDEWSDSDHKAVQALADSHGLPFLDYNYEPFFTDTGYNQALDTREGYHPNDYGAAKITQAIGDYLIENGFATDVRSNGAYQFMYEQALGYHAMTDDLQELRNNVDVVDYLAQVIQNPSYTVYMGVDGLGAGLLTPDQQRRLEALGFDWMASLEPGQCYRAVVQDGSVINEDLATRADKRLYTCYDSADFILPKHAFFSMFSSDDQEAIDAMAYSADRENAEKPKWVFANGGVSIIVYDNSIGAVVDMALFRADAHLKRYCDPQATLDAYLQAGAQDWELPWYLWQLKLYNESCAETKETGPKTAEDALQSTILMALL